MARELWYTVIGLDQDELYPIMRHVKAFGPDNAAEVARMEWEDEGVEVASIHFVFYERQPNMIWHGSAIDTEDLRDIDAETELIERMDRELRGDD